MEAKLFFRHSCLEEPALQPLRHTVGWVWPQIDIPNRLVDLLFFFITTNPQFNQILESIIYFFNEIFVQPIQYINISSSFNIPTHRSICWFPIWSLELSYFYCDALKFWCFDVHNVFNLYSWAWMSTKSCSQSKQKQWSKLLFFWISVVIGVDDFVEIV